MRIHVLFLSSWFPSKVHSTLGNFVLNHAEAAAKECDVSILYLAKQTTINNIQLDEEIVDGIRIVRVYYPKNGFFFRTRFKAFKVGYRHLFANKNFPNIIQMNMIWPEGWQAWFLKKKFKIPYCISDNWTGYHADQRAPLSFFQKKYMQFIANNSNKLIPVTSHLESAMRHINFKVESEIIPNVINLNIFTSERKADSNTIQFLHVSHLDDNHKNISGILRVWKEIAKEHSNVHLKIGGDGPVEKWKSFARQLEIPPRSISFFGTSSSKEIASIMHSSHAFVLFSNYENLPLVIIEAMACGLAVISTDVGGCKEFLPLELGHFLIQKKNESELKNALEIAIETATKIDRKAISEFAKEHFSQEVIGKKLNQVYQSILHDKI